MEEPNLSKEEINRRIYKLTNESKRITEQMNQSTSVIKTQLLKRHLDHIIYDINYYNKLLSRYW